MHTNANNETTILRSAPTKPLYGILSTHDSLIRQSQDQQNLTMSGVGNGSDTQLQALQGHNCTKDPHYSPQPQENRSGSITKAPADESPKNHIANPRKKCSIVDNWTRSPQHFGQKQRSLNTGNK